MQLIKNRRYFVDNSSARHLPLLAWSFPAQVHARNCSVVNFKVFVSRENLMPDGSNLFRPTLWGLVLAAGDGRRLQDHVAHVKGKQLPKQFVNFIGRRSMLEHTFDRAERLIDAERLITIVTRHHFRHPEVRDQLGRRPRETIVIQPENKETGPGILLPLMFLKKRCPEAIVALFPSDHFILEEERFMIHVRRAVEAVAHDSGRLVLLAIAPREPEIEYGYIMPSESGANACRFGTKPIRAFLEKPKPQRAYQLIRDGALWNTMTIVFKLNTFLNLVRAVQPAIQRRFDRLLSAIDSPGERQAIESLYRELEPMNFSTAIMEPLAECHRERLAVLAVRQVLWSDWGSPERIRQTLNMLRQWRTGTSARPQPSASTASRERSPRHLVASATLTVE
jgi:mannose-1-phosphate guanylyltransferase